jgi:hypothetical protein
MTLPERLYACPAAIHPSPPRATARYAGVRFNPDGDPHNAYSTVQNQPRFPAEHRRRDQGFHRFLSSPIPAGHLAPIEFP